MDTADRSIAQRPPLWAIALLSGAALAYEVLLTRLFAIIQWHHFSYMIISLALLGFGASGTLLTLLRAWVARAFMGFFVANTLAFAGSAVAAFLLAQQLPFNALEIAWDPWQFLYLLGLYIILAIPFFCVANAVGAAFVCYGDQIARIYAFDLVGAGAGALIVVLLLFVFAPMRVLFGLGLVGLCAAALAMGEAHRWSRVAIGVGLLLIGLSISLPERWTELQLSPYKDLSQALKVMGAETVAQRTNPLGVVDVVANTQIPFRFAPGLSLAATALPPPQLGLFSDGNAMGAITQFNGDWRELTYLDHLTSALPYHLLPPHPRVLILGAGGGADVLQGLYHGARRVDAVELNGDVAELLQNRFAEFTGGVFNRPQVRFHIAEARGFIAASRNAYDLIQVALLDAFSTTSAGLYALSESYLYTVEALQTYIQHLTPDGMLAITRWLRIPPRDSLKLFATAAVALERSGVADPGAQLMLIRGWKTTTLVVKNTPFSAAQISALQTFSRSRSFDVAWYPGIPASATNRYNLLEQPYLYQGARALLGSRRDAFLQDYKFHIAPATDDRPYFFSFFKWRVLPELLALRAQSGFGQLEWGYVILVATLLQALIAGAVLILLPLHWLKNSSPDAVSARQRRRVFIYFGAIGLGFLSLEIAFIQKFILFLSHPLYAIAVVLSGFLLFAGLGSRYAQRLLDRRWGLAGPVAAIVVFALGYLAALPALFSLALAWPDPIKVILAVTLIAPLAFCMGMPFPLGLTRVARTAASLLPWAWAINGCASVVSAVLATLVAVHGGFSLVVAIALLLYVIALAAAPDRR